MVFDMTSTETSDVDGVVAFIAEQPVTSTSRSSASCPPSSTPETAGYTDDGEARRVNLPKRRTVFITAGP
jgi:hypothetical protein